MADNKDKKHYISRAESRQIARENSKAIRRFEKQKKRRAKPDDYTTQMKDDNNIIEFDDLHTYFFSDAGTVKAVNGVSFSIPAGSTVGVVGESGCGKSVTSLSLMQLVQAPSGQIVSGSIRFKASLFKRDERGRKIPVYETEIGADGVERVKLNAKGKKIIKKNSLGGNLYEMEDRVVDIAKMPTEAMRSIRGREISMIFQEPMTSLNPVFTIGNQLDEVGLLHIEGISKKQVKAHSIDMLKLVGIADPEGVYKKYPHELSGGMRQRVALIRTLAAQPDILLLDEPFSALDYQTRLKVCDDVQGIIKSEKKTAILVTHDMSEAIALSDKVIVLSARPATVVAEHRIDFGGNNPKSRRECPKFSETFEILRSELGL